MAIAQSTDRPYAEGDTVHFSTYADRVRILTGTIERVGGDWERPESMCVRIFFIREARTKELYSTARELIYGFVYS